MTTMPFGKHKGQAIELLEDSYLQWLNAPECELREPLRSAIRAEVTGRQQDAPSPAPPATRQRTSPDGHATSPAPADRWIAGPAPATPRLPSRHSVEVILKAGFAAAPKQPESALAEAWLKARLAELS